MAKLMVYFLVSIFMLAYEPASPAPVAALPASACFTALCGFRATGSSLAILATTPLSSWLRASLHEAKQLQTFLLHRKR